MMDHLLRRLFSAALVLIALCLESQAQRRAVMEGLAASNDAIFVSTPMASVYVRTAGTMTVSGGSFSVGGASFTVAGGSATVAYSMTAARFIGDGSSLTGLPVSQSTVTNNLTGSTTETTNFDICYATGTLTLSAGTQVQVYYSGDITNSGAVGNYCVVNFLQDGAFISPATRTIGMGKSNNAAAGGSGNATTIRLFPSPGAGSHSYCISMISPFGTTCTFTANSVLGNQYGVTEFR